MDVWELGNYEIVGDWFAPASRTVLDGGAMPTEWAGRTLTDVACGSGVVAIEAARRGAQAVGVDATASMLAIAQRRADAAGVNVTWRQCWFEDLSGCTPADVVTSSFGVIIAGNPPAVAGELDRATTEDGVVGLTAWHPDGLFGSSPPALGGGGTPAGPTLWSNPEIVDQFFAATGRRVVEHRRATLRIEFADADQAVEEISRWCGPWMMLATRLAQAGGEEWATAVLTEHVAAHAETTERGIAVCTDYTVTHLRRP